MTAEATGPTRPGGPTGGASASVANADGAAPLPHLASCTLTRSNGPERATAEIVAPQTAALVSGPAGSCCARVGALLRGTWDARRPQPEGTRRGERLHARCAVILRPSSRRWQRRPCLRARGTPRACPRTACGHAERGGHQAASGRSRGRRARLGPVRPRHGGRRRALRRHGRVCGHLPPSAPVLDAERWAPRRDRR